MTNQEFNPFHDFEQDPGEPPALFQESEFVPNRSISVPDHSVIIGNTDPDTYLIEFDDTSDKCFGFDPEESLSLQSPNTLFFDRNIQEIFKSEKTPPSAIQKYYCIGEDTQFDKNNHAKNKGTNEHDVRPANDPHSTSNQFEGVFNQIFETIITNEMKTYREGDEEMVSPDFPSSDSNTSTSENHQCNDDKRFFTTYKDPNVMQIEDDVTIQCKTRIDPPSDQMPQIFYSTIKYQLIQKAHGNFIRDIPLIVASCSLLDADTGAPVQKHHDTSPTFAPGSEVVTGLTKRVQKSDNTAECKSKIQFDFSFHKEKKETYLEIQYFLPHKLNDPILIKRSPCFRIYARKPNKRPRSNNNKTELQKHSKKRKKTKKN